MSGGMGAASMISRIQAIIFDFDGLILDTETPDYRSWQAAYAEFGLELPLTVWQANIGSVDLFDPYLYLEEQLGRSLDRTAVHARRRILDDELIAAQTVLPGVADYLDEAGRLGLGTAVASSSRHSWVDPHLQRLGLSNRFDRVFCRDDAGDVSKPHPAVYRAALTGLGLLPEQAIALEDSLNGVYAAKAAGLACVAVPNEMTRHLDFAEADWRLESLATMPLAELLLRIG